MLLMCSCFYLLRLSFDSLDNTYLSFKLQPRSCLLQAVWSPWHLYPHPLEQSRAGCRYRLLLRAESRPLTAAHAPSNQKQRITPRTETHGGEWGLLGGRMQLSWLKFSWATSQSCFHLVNLNIKNSLFVLPPESSRLLFSLFKLLIWAQPQRNHFSHKTILKLKKNAGLVALRRSHHLSRPCCGC